MTPFIIIFALVCCVLSLGLKYRFVWMWYAGWALLYLFAAYFGSLFFSAIYFSETYRGVAFSSVYFLGGFVLWVPAAIWWSRNRAIFGRPVKK